MKRILITGASRGLGLGFAKFYQQTGHKVYAACRNPETATELNNLQQFGNLIVLPMDVTDERSIRTAHDTVAAMVSALDLVINNAGVAGDKAPFGSISPEEMIEVYRANAVGPLMVSQLFVPLLKRGHSPVLAHITSRMGSIADNASSGWHAYRASKAALNMLNTCLALDLQRDGIISVVLHPGWVATDMGGGGAPLDVETSINGLASVLEKVTPDDSGGFFAYDGERLPW